jgi:hypothetical protein
VVKFMEGTKRQHTLGIWGLTLGYFLFYVPYCGLSKAVTSGLLTGGHPIPGPELLPAAGISTATTVLLFIIVARWWKYGRKRQVFGVNVIFPRRQTFISGIGFATIILTTTLAYSFSGVSIVFALVLMRAGVLIMSPLIDRIFRRHIRWFSWAGLTLSLAALAISFSDIHEYKLTLGALLNLAAYLAGHALRLPSMTQIAKTGEAKIARAYFVEEQTVAMTVLVGVPTVLAVLGGSELAHQLRSGFAQSFNSFIGAAGFMIGFFYAGLGICLSFIYLDRRENTFCMPLFACSSLLSGIVASYVLTWWLQASAPSRIQIEAAFLIITALLIMSPLHHVPLYIRQLQAAIREKRLVLVRLVFNSQEDMTEVVQTPASSLITIDIRAVRNVFRK